MALEWFSFLPAEILPEEVPSANEVIYLPNCGSIIISTEQPYNFENPEMRKVTAAIEQELHHLGLLPLVDHFGIPQIRDLPFISREQRLKNMSLGKRDIGKQNAGTFCPHFFVFIKYKLD